MSKARITFALLAMLAIAATTSIFTSCVKTSGPASKSLRNDSAPLLEEAKSEADHEAEAASLLEGKIDALTAELEKLDERGENVKIQLAITIDGEVCGLDNEFFRGFSIHILDRDIGSEWGFDSLYQLDLSEGELLGDCFFFRDTEFTAPKDGKERSYSLHPPEDWKDERTLASGVTFNLNRSPEVLDLLPVQRGKLVDFGKISLELLDFAEYADGYYSVEGRVILADGSPLSSLGEWRYLYSGDLGSDYEQLGFSMGTNGRFKFFRPNPMTQAEWETRSERRYRPDFFGFYREGDEIKRREDTRFIWSTNDNDVTIGFAPNGMWTKAATTYDLALKKIEGDRYRLADIVVDLAQVDMTMSVDLGDRYFWKGTPRPSAQAIEIDFPEGQDVLADQLGGYLKNAAGFSFLTDLLDELRGDICDTISRRMVVDEGDTLFIVDFETTTTEEGETVFFSCLPRVVRAELGKTLEVQLVLKPALSFFVAIEDEGGTPIELPNVQGLGEVGEVVATEFPHGRWEFIVTNLLPDGKKVEVSAEGYAKRSFLIDPESPPTRIVLQKHSKHDKGLAASLHKPVNISVKPRLRWSTCPVPIAIYWREAGSTSPFKRAEKRFYLVGGEASMLAFAVPKAVQEIEYYLEFADERARTDFGCIEERLTSTREVELEAEDETDALLEGLADLIRPAGGIPALSDSILDDLPAHFRVSIDALELDDYSIYYGDRLSFSASDKRSRSALSAVLIGERPLTKDEITSRHLKLKANLQIDLGPDSDSVAALRVTHRASGFMQELQYKSQRTYVFSLPAGEVDIQVLGDSWEPIVEDVIEHQPLATSRWSMPKTIGLISRRDLFHWEDGLFVELAHKETGPWMSNYQSRFLVATGSWFARVVDQYGAVFDRVSIEVKEARQVFDLEFRKEQLYSASLRIKLPEIEARRLAKMRVKTIAAFVQFEGEEGFSTSIRYRSVVWMDGDIFFLGLPPMNRMRLLIALSEDDYVAFMPEATQIVKTPWLTLEAERETSINIEGLIPVNTQESPESLPLQGFESDAIDEQVHFEIRKIDGEGEPLHELDWHQDRPSFWELRPYGDVRREVCPALRIPVVFDDEYPLETHRAIAEWFAKLQRVLYPK